MNVLFFGDQWDDKWRRRQQIALRMARWSSVDSLIYIECPLTLTSLAKFILGRADGEAHKRWRRVMRYGLQTTLDGVQVVTPLVIGPLSPVPAVHAVNNHSMVWTGLGSRGRFANGDLLVWVSMPAAVRWLPHFPEAFICYDATERFSESPWEDDRRRRLLREWDDQLADQADLVLVQTEHHLREKRQLNSATFLVPNAVDVSRFQTDLPIRPPDDIVSISPPRIGYVGAINSRINWQLVESIAGAKPSWQIVFIGNGDPRRCGGDGAASLRNMHFLGEKPYSAVPAYLACFDVCIAPLRRDELTASQSLLKLFDYMASGKPIVSTKADVALQSSGAIYVANDPAAFIASIQTALNESEHLSLHRRRIAAQNSWDTRVLQIREILDDHLPEHWRTEQSTVA